MWTALGVLRVLSCRAPCTVIQLRTALSQQELVLTIVGACGNTNPCVPALPNTSSTWPVMLSLSF